MFEDLVEAVAGPWGIAAVLLLATAGGRKMIRTAAKEAVKVGIVVSEKVKEVAAEIQEEASDVLAEAQAERKEQAKETSGKKHQIKASS